MIHQQVGRRRVAGRSSQTLWGDAQQLLAQFGFPGARIEPDGEKRLSQLQKTGDIFVYKKTESIAQPHHCNVTVATSHRWRCARVDPQTAGDSGFPAADIPGRKTLGTQRGGLVVRVAGGGRADPVFPRH
ncbi:hypothetical protein D3C86_1813240 [compost metagenome]